MVRLNLSMVSALFVLISVMDDISSSIS